MKLNFWTQFAIQEALTVVQVLITHTNLNPNQKQLLENFIASGQALLTTF